MIDKAMSLVNDYINEHIDHSNPNAEPSLFVVWQATILDNYKCLIRSTLPRGAYFELTYDSAEKCWYFDVYQKIDHRLVDDG